MTFIKTSLTPERPHCEAGGYSSEYRFWRRWRVSARASWPTSSASLGCKPATIRTTARAICGAPDRSMSCSFYGVFGSDRQSAASSMSLLGGCRAARASVVDRIARGVSTNCVLVTISLSSAGSRCGVDAERADFPSRLVIRSSKPPSAYPSPWWQSANCINSVFLAKVDIGTADPCGLPSLMGVY